MSVAAIRRKRLWDSSPRRMTALDVIQEPQIKELAKFFEVTISAMKIRLETPISLASR